MAVGREAFTAVFFPFRKTRQGFVMDYILKAFLPSYPTSTCLSQKQDSQHFATPDMKLNCFEINKPERVFSL